MKWMIPYLVLSVFIESTLMPIPVTLVIIIIIAIGTGQRSLWWAFIAGIILDFLSIRILGTSSLFFLAVSYLIYRYQQKIYLAGKIYTLIFILAATSVYSFLFYRTISIISAAIIFSFAILCLYFYPRLFPEAISGKKKLSV